MILQAAVTAVPHYACASAAGLTESADKLHFGTGAARELGARYAAAMLALQRAAGPPDPKP